MLAVRSNRYRESIILTFFNPHSFFLKETVVNGMALGEHSAILFLEGTIPVSSTQNHFFLLLLVLVL